MVEGEEPAPVLLGPNAVPAAVVLVGVEPPTVVCEEAPSELKVGTPMAELVAVPEAAALVAVAAAPDAVN